MKFSILLAIFFALSAFTTGDTVDTYDWKAYETALKKVHTAIAKVVEANVILHDNYDVDFDALPKRTKSQLAILQDAAYISWLMAEEDLGKTEAAKYWEQFKPKEDSNLKCFEKSLESLGAIVPKSYANIKTCALGTRTACHLEEIKKMVRSDIAFHKCLKDRYGEDDVFTFTKDPTIVNH